MCEIYGSFSLPPPTFYLTIYYIAGNYLGITLGVFGESTGIVFRLNQSHHQIQAINLR